LRQPLHAREFTPIRRITNPAKSARWPARCRTSPNGPTWPNCDVTFEWPCRPEVATRGHRMDAAAPCARARWRGCPGRHGA
jgi:hypothetical protein